MLLASSSEIQPRVSLAMRRLTIGTLFQTPSFWKRLARVIMV